ncbi:hypothetical protein LTR84_000236 [Exophiala bonariae]|uniref:Nitronate monooxygenase domain-containing protein n=1 Tax=Exophiala bonariae TaxID=1690606 RepID=A0AAV9NTQ1_9EURO|nr:hypothetical protein LTR84_000236 [Exophiala bonariae]
MALQRKSGQHKQIQTPLTDLFRIRHPIMLAGMGPVSSPKLAAEVTNAGGIGVIGGYGYTPDQLREQIKELKSYLHAPDAAWGVDLLIPQVGGQARKTNYDYTKGKLDELITIIIEYGATVFVCAVGIPPKHVVDRLHQHGVLYMNMIGHPKHVQKCLNNDVDILCAQGGEGGGHTGNIPFSILIPAIVQNVMGHKSKFTGHDVQVVAAGGISNGTTIAAALMMGATGVWVGTRFLVAHEANCSSAHKEAVLSADFDATVRTTIYTGRPLRVKKTPYVLDWETNRQKELKELTSNGVLPIDHDAEQRADDDEFTDNLSPFLMGKVAGLITKRQSAQNIVDELFRETVDALARAKGYLTAKL